ncbi:MAG TPA: DHHA1 domain-containing protein [Gemmatimonadales bacterium]|nr:DHHA1 domain-containing protein [Gemmatimonadales bacterium]
MTQRLYYLDSHLRNFEASVVERAEEGRRIYLDRTAFYPTSGGQLHDTGRLEGIEVAEVVDEGERVAHLLVEPLVSGPTVRGELNWPRRLDHMQQHTGQHLLSAVLADLWDYPTTSVHLGELTSTLDLDTSQLTSEQVVQAEMRTNEFIAENRPVTVTFEDASSATGLRKPSSRSGAIRIVSIEGLDRSACGGTHVTATGAIGALLVRKVERVRKGVRLEFLCGLRAIGRSRLEFNVLSNLATELSSSFDELPRVVANQRADVKALSASKRALEADLSRYRAQELYASAQPDPAGVRRATVRLADGGLDDLRGLALAFAGFPRAVFIGAIDAPPSVLLSAAPDSGIDAASVLKETVSIAGGRGGGSSTMAQGVLPGKAQLEHVLSVLEGTK